MEGIVIRVEFYEGRDIPILDLQCSAKGIKWLTQIMQELAHGRIGKIKLHSYQFVEIRFAGEVSLQVIDRRRLADNVDVDIVYEQGFRRISWRASCDEWADNVEKVKGLADSDVRAFQYLAVPSCPVGIRVNHYPSFDEEADSTADQEYS